jgi:transposase
VAKPQTAEAIATWAEDKTKPTEGYTYKRLTDAERILILGLYDKGMSQEAIAQQLKRSSSTINDVIQSYTPTVDLAKRRLKSAASRMAENIIENGLPRDHVAALKGINVLEETDSSVPRVVVQIGTQNGDVQVSLSPSPQAQIGEGQ